MLQKMIYVVSLMAIFAGEFWGMKYYIQNVHKGRWIDTIIEILLFIIDIVILSAFTLFYNKLFPVF